MRILTDFADQAVLLPLILAVGTILLALGWGRAARAWAFAVPGTLVAMLVLKIIFLACAPLWPDLKQWQVAIHTVASVLSLLLLVLLENAGRRSEEASQEKLNVLAKASKGKLDPIASCPTLRGLVKAEGDLLKYLEANKNWCNVPDEAVNNLKTADAKSQAFATQACNLAVQVKKQQQQAASSPSLGVEAQKLPAGPL